jgi:hypothetical protein
LQQSEKQKHETLLPLNNSLLSLNIYITKINGKPAIELRRRISCCKKNSFFIRNLIKSALRDEPITANVIIVLNNKNRAIQRMREVGIID